MTEKLADTISGAFLLAASVAMGAMAQSLPRTISDQYAGPGFMPTVLSIALALCAVGILIQAQGIPRGRRMPGWSGADLGGAVRIAVVLAATAAYNLLLQPVGYILTSLCYLIFLLWFLQVSWRLNLIISLVATLATYAMFSIWLRVVLPMGLIEIYF